MVKQVFISHGHNEPVKLKLRNFVKERLKIDPVILDEQPDAGLTVIEKLEKYGRSCEFAVIILTADDHTIDGGARARQNVLHELGFFHGSLGRDRVLLLKQAGVELFSNISGLIYKEFDGQRVESVFEHVRSALESCSAEKGGLTVPITKPSGPAALFQKGLDALMFDGPRIERGRIKQRMRACIEGLPGDLQIRRIKKFLQNERVEYENRLAKAKADDEEGKELLRASPRDTGRWAASVLGTMKAVAPEGAIRLINDLLSELAFAESEGISTTMAVERLLALCDAEAPITG